jgi:hypothetical protein
MSIADWVAISLSALQQKLSAADDYTTYFFIAVKISQDARISPIISIFRHSIRPGD